MAEDAGALLVRSGLVSSSSLDDARARVADHGGTLGEQLVAAGAVSDEALTDFYKSRLLVPQVNPNSLARLPAKVVAVIPSEMAIELRAIPVSLDADHNLAIAMSDPSDRRAVDEIAAFTGMSIVRAVATQMQIAWCLAHYYGHVTQLGQRLLQPNATTPPAGTQPASRPRPRGMTGEIEAARHRAIAPGTEQPAKRAHSISGEIRVLGRRASSVKPEIGDDTPTITIEIADELSDPVITIEPDEPAPTAPTAPGRPAVPRRSRPAEPDPPELAARAGEVNLKATKVHVVEPDEPLVVISPDELEAPRPGVKTSRSVQVSGEVVVPDKRAGRSVSGEIVDVPTSPVVILAEPSSPVVIADVPTSPVEIPDEPSSPIHVRGEGSGPFEIHNERSYPLEIRDFRSAPISMDPGLIALPAESSAPRVIPDQPSAPLMIPDQPSSPLHVRGEGSGPLEIHNERSYPLEVRDFRSAPIETGSGLIETGSGLIETGSGLISTGSGPIAVQDEPSAPVVLHAHVSPESQPILLDRRRPSEAPTNVPIKPGSARAGVIVVDAEKSGPYPRPDRKTEMGIGVVAVPPRATGDSEQGGIPNAIEDATTGSRSSPIDLDPTRRDALAAPPGDYTSASEELLAAPPNPIRDDDTSPNVIPPAPSSATPPPSGQVKLSGVIRRSHDDDDDDDSAVGDSTTMVMSARDLDSVIPQRASDALPAYLTHDDDYDPNDEGWGPPGTTIPPPMLGAIPGSGGEPTSGIIPLPNMDSPALMVAAPALPEKSGRATPAADPGLARALEEATSRVLELISALAQTTDRDEVIALMIGHLAKSHQRAGFLAARGRELSMFAMVPRPDTIPFATLRLDRPSTLQDIVDTRLPYRGPMQDDASRTFLAAILGSAPKEILLVPVTVRERVVGVLFGVHRLRHSFDDQLALAGRAAGIALERILKTKRA